MSHQSTLKNPSPWLVLGCITLLQSVNGARFSIFSTCSSPPYKTCQFSHSQIKFLIVALETGKIFGPLAGPVANYVPASIILIVGLIFGSVGYGVQYLSISNKINSLSYWQFLLLNVLAGNSTCWISSYCYVLAIRNFKNCHRPLIAITSSYSGFSGKIFTILAEGIQGRKNISRNSNVYLKLIFLGPAIVGLIAATISYSVKSKQYLSIDMPLFAIMVAFATGLYIVIECIVLKYSTHVSLHLRATSLVLVLMLPFVIAVLAMVIKIQKCSSRKPPELSDNEWNDQSTRVEHYEIEIDDEKGDSDENENKSINEVSLNRLMNNVDFWLFYLVNACGVTLGMLYMINLEIIFKSLSSDKESFLMEISSSFIFFGKIFSVMFDWFSRKKLIISNPAMTVLVLLPMPIAFFLLINNNSSCLYISTGILGTCSGALNVITATTTYELFGLKNFPVKHTIVLTNVPVSILVFGCLHAIPEGDEMCIGLHCFSRTFMIWGSLCFVATVLSFVLHLRTQNLYLHKS
ncbi:protein NUCLEAR FUSION DEFECTIVE 4-like [Mercurialis annua]|uniref:protein NUCLEAR FUSION DEFECTIVE 4-like n=1 Tax=Mercurialis annua TaxID=3986 RepID=UPI00215F8CAF|nr:protein NUCLEAR FUSION DEFECTIVE 4-like [Mercurialis annua]